MDFVRKAVRSIGRLAIKVEPAADNCIKTLLGLIETKVSYVVPEAIIVIKDIFRRYPGKYEGIIPTLCEQLDVLEEPEAKAAMIWIIGQYADRIDNADELLDDLLYTFKEDPVEVRSVIMYQQGLSHHIHRSNLRYSLHQSSYLYTKLSRSLPKSLCTRSSNGPPRRSIILISAIEASCTGECWQLTLQ